LRAQRLGKITDSSIWQSGQVLPIGLLLIALGAMCLWWVSDAALAVSEKRRLTHAADMAALSGAVWQARTLNFDAYMNRAIIANEAVIAQSVSLRSFVDYTAQLLQNSATVTTWVPFLGQALRVLDRVWSGIERSLSVGLTALEVLTSLADHDLALAQRLMHLGAAREVPKVARQQVQLIDPRFELTAGGEAALTLWQLQWPRFASFYGGAFRWRQQNVLYRSMDGFSAERQFRWPRSSAWGFRIERRGGTELVNFESWQAADTLSLHLRRHLFFGSLRERVPLGWGAAAIGARRVRPVRRESFSSAFRVNPRAARLAERTTLGRSGYGGLPSVFDLSVAQRRQFDPQPVTVRLRLPHASRQRGFALPRMLSNSAATNEGERSEYSDSDFFAEASASVWFARPEPRSDGQHELPHLFSPYWHARLQPLDSAQRILMATADKTPIGLAGVTP
jgi:hypothetical protein